MVSVGFLPGPTLTIFYSWPVGAASGIFLMSFRDLRKLLSVFTLCSTVTTGDKVAVALWKNKRLTPYELFL
jgi:hypothetical protein